MTIGFKNKITKRKNMTNQDTILFIGDIHIKFNNIADIERVEEELSSLENISFIVLAGDILDTHERVHTQLLNRAYDLIKKLRLVARVYILVGNHDYIDNRQFLTDKHWMNGMKEWQHVYVIDYPTMITTENDQKFCMVPYVPPGRFVEALEKVPDWQSSTCIFAHQEMRNCKMGCIISSEGDEWKNEWPLVISGHIHEKQKVGENIIYPGSVLNHSFGYDCQGVSVFSFKNERLFSEDVIDLKLVKKSIIRKKISEFHKIPKEKFVKENKFCLSGNFKEIKEFKSTREYANLIKSGIKVTMRLEKTETETPTEEEVKEISTPFVEILNDLIGKENDEQINRDFIAISS